MAGLVDEDCDMVTLDGLKYSHLNSMKRQGHKGTRHSNTPSAGTNHLLQKNKQGTLGRDSSYHIDV